MDRFGCLFLHAVEMLLSLMTEFGDLPDVFPPRGYRRRGAHEWWNSARTTGEIEQQICPITPQRSPGPRTRRVRNRRLSNTPGSMR